ncbi:MAG: transporter substrate-binding domain-containing protein [Caldilineaceae bacterium]
MQQQNQTTLTVHWWAPSSSHHHPRALLLITLSLSLALLLCILYTEISWANSNSASINHNAVRSEQPAPIPIAAVQTFTDTQPSTIETIRERGYLIVGVKEDAPPFGFYDDITNDLIGFEVELVLAMAAEWGLTPDDVLLEPVTSANRIQKLIDGEVDLVVATMTHNKARDELIDFSQTYFLDGQDVLVRADSGIEQVVDLAGKSVAAAEGSTSLRRIIAYADERQMAIEPVALEGYPDAVERLLAGQVDAVTTDRGILTYYAADPALRLLRDEEFTELTEPYGMGVRSGDSYFLNLVNFTLQDLKRNGTYDELYTEWFGTDSEPYAIELLPGVWPYTLDDSPIEVDNTVSSKVEQLRENGYFIAGVKADAPPFGYVDEESGELIGFEVDLMKEFARRWLGDEEAVLFEEVTSATRGDKLAQGEIDIIAATMTHTQPRDELIDFSQTYFRDGQTVLVRQDSGIFDFNALDGKIVAGIAGSTSISRVLTYADDNGITIEVAALEGYVDGVERLRNGDIDAITTDKGILTYFAQQYPDELMLIPGETFSDEPYGLGVPNFDHRFRDLVNFTLQEMWEDGSYARLYAKWFGNAAAYPIEVWPGVSYLTDVSLTPWSHSRR